MAEKERYDLSILTPTRERFDQCVEMVKSLVASKAEHTTIEMMFAVDRDDPQLEQYLVLPETVVESLEEELTNISIKVIYQADHDLHISSLWNFMAQICNGDWMMMGNDDLRFDHEGWDTALMGAAQKYEDEIVCVWGDDGINGGKHCAFPMVSRKWVDTIGYFVPEQKFNFFFHDTWVFDIANRLSRALYVPDAKITHRHFSKFRRERDGTTDRARANHQSPPDPVRFRNGEKERQEDSEKLRAVIVDYATAK